MYIITSTAPKVLTSDTTSNKNLVTIDTHSKISKFYGVEKITTEEIMDELDMF